MLDFHTHGNEIRYSFDSACQMLHSLQPTTLRLCTSDVKFAQAAARRLAWLKGAVFVDNEEIAEAVAEFPFLEVSIAPRGLTYDAALVPFSRHLYTSVPDARYMVTLSENAFSYKGVLYPGKVKDSVTGLLRWIRPQFEIMQSVGVLGWRCMFEALISQMAGTKAPATHFLHGQRSLDHIYSHNWSRWMSYILVTLAQRKA